MKSKINPSPAILVQGNTTLADCVQLMRKQKVGSLLVVNEQGKGELIGIFTERDLLLKTEISTKGIQWQNTVRTVMTQPVISLDISELPNAAEVMLKNYIRHLPITVFDDMLNMKVVMGVISMRDLFRFYWSESHDKKLAFFDVEKVQLRAKIISADDKFISFIQKVLKSFLTVEATVADLTQELITGCRLLVVDLDQLPLQTWTQFLIAKSHDSAIELIVVAFNPSLVSEEVTNTLEKLGQSDRFLIFKKPIDVFQLYEKFRSFFKTSRSDTLQK
jgi:CBS domain-containing protein